MAALLALALAASLPASSEPSQGCPWESLLGDTPLGMSDRNATYGWSWFEVKPGERIVLHAHYPHARYLSFVVQDQDGMVVDALDDVAIQPDGGSNPFLPGRDRRKRDLGTYTLTVSPEGMPPAGRAPNTLYAGREHEGGVNRLILLNMRVYLTDKAFNKASGHPEWKTGGVPAPMVNIVDPGGRALPCPPAGAARAAWRARQPTTAQQTQSVPSVPGQSAPQDPPRWFHSSRVANRTTNRLGPNDSTVYASTALSARFGRVVELRWKPPATPTRTSLGGRFPAHADMRYWSLSFMYADPQARDFGGIRTERTVADYEAPIARNGEARLFIGLDGAPRPKDVPPEAWVGLKMRDGVMMLRETLVSPAYAGDLGRIERGYVPEAMSRSVPSLTYRAPPDAP